MEMDIPMLMNFLKQAGVVINILFFGGLIGVLIILFEIIYYSVERVSKRFYN